MEDSIRTSVLGLIENTCEAMRMPSSDDFRTGTFVEALSTGIINVRRKTKAQEMIKCISKCTSSEDPFCYKFSCSLFGYSHPLHFSFSSFTVMAVMARLDNKPA